MQAQEVMLQAMAKKIAWFQAAEIMGIRPAHRGGGGNVTRRAGFAGGLTRDEGSLRRKRVPTSVLERVSERYREKNFDGNVRHFPEKLAREHPIRLGYSWVRRPAARRRGDARVGCIANGARGGRCRECSCTSTAAASSGFRTNAGTT
jgi:hypothetical protein